MRPVDLTVLPEGACGLAVYEYSADSLALIARVLRDPADLSGLPEGVCGLVVYEYSADSLALIAHMLRGEVIPRRKAKV